MIRTVLNGLVTYGNEGEEEGVRFTPMNKLIALTLLINSKLFFSFPLWCCWAHNSQQQLLRRLCGDSECVSLRLSPSSSRSCVPLVHAGEHLSLCRCLPSVSLACFFLQGFFFLFLLCAQVGDYPFHHFNEE